jgi:6-phosphogluconolactonase (cycloisomerase 2 family)
MSTRFACLLGTVVVLVAIGMLLACGSIFHRGSDGLMLVASQGSSLVQTFSFTLATGTITGISNPTSDTTNLTCVLPGFPGQMVIDPTGTFVYMIINHVAPCNPSANGIMVLKVNSDGTIANSGTVTPDPNPIALTLDSTGKFLYVAEGLSMTSIQNSLAQQTPCVQTATQNGICVYSISSGALTTVPQTFNLPPQLGFQPSNFVGLALTPTVFPAVKNGTQTAACFQQSAPTSEFLYLVDQPNNVVWEFDVNMSTGALTVSSNMVAPGAPFPTDQLPAGIAVDPCNRFVYVSDSLTAKLSAYTLCSAVIQGTCPGPVPDGRLLQVAGSPFSLTGTTVSPGPVAVDPLGNNVYVLDTGASHVFSFHIGPTTGAVTAGTPASVATGQRPSQFALSSDGNWMFVSNFNSGTVSQYQVTPLSGTLAPLPDITTDNQPTGIAVK